jgi:hypothetical protein
MKIEAHCYYALCCVTRKVEDLCIWIYVVIFDTIAMITIFYTVVLSVIQRVALNTRVLPLAKGRALQQNSRKHDAIVPVPVFCYFCVSERLHRKYSRDWTKR